MSVRICRYIAVQVLAVLMVVIMQAGSAAAYEIKLGYYNCDHMTAAPVAEAMGIYKKYGLGVKVTGNGKVPEAMAAGQMDAGYVGVTRLFRAYLKGAPILFAAGNHTGGSEYLVVRKGSGIKTPADLVGRKIMLGAMPHKTNGNWINYATANNLPLDPKHYKNFAMTDMDAYLALKAGHLDAFDTCDPWGSMAIYEDTGDIMATFQGTTGRDDGLCCVFTMNRNFVKNHRALAVSLIHAHVDAIKAIYIQPKKCAEIFAKAYSVPEEVALMTLYRKTVHEGRTMDWRYDTSRVEKTAVHCHTIGLLDEAVDLKDFINTGLYEEAAPEDFETFIKTEVDPVFPVTLTYEEWKAIVLSRESAG
ncbi:ABC transporter substrate-binding protein [Desulfosarcina sp. OttesenSCG-928-B08]|nr:ABC transporter substrate-binding protein [Desulfosarcina sp. OttesenSCG-928-B08]